MWPMQIVQPNTLTGCSTRLVLLTPRAARRHRRRRYTSPWPPSSSPAQTGYPSGHTEIIMHWSVLQFQSSDMAFLPGKFYAFTKAEGLHVLDLKITTMVSAIFHMQTLESFWWLSITGAKAASWAKFRILFMAIPFLCKLCKLAGFLSFSDQLNSWCGRNG